MNEIIEVTFNENYDYNDEWDGWNIVIKNKLNNEVVDFYGVRNAYEIFKLLNWFRVLNPSIKIICIDKYPQEIDWFEFDDISDLLEG